MKSDSLFWGCCFLDLVTVPLACGTEETVSGKAEKEKVLVYHSLPALSGLPGNSPGGIKTNFSTFLGTYREALIYAVISKANCSFNNTIVLLFLMLVSEKKKKVGLGEWC